MEKHYSTTVPITIYKIGTVGFRTSDRFWMVGMVGVGSNSHEQLARGGALGARALIWRDRL